MFETYVGKIVSIWWAGGWVMIPMLALSLMIYGMATQLLLYFSKREYAKHSQEEWMGWVRDPGSARGEVGEIIRYTQDEATTPDDIHCRFAEVAGAKLPAIDRRLSTLNTLIAAAPLLGLLGTVFGMLVTFKALATGGGQVTDQMAAGISQALFPPEVGLCIALPGLMLVHLIKRKRQEYEAFLAQLESCTIQLMRQRFARRAASDAAVSRPHPVSPGKIPVGLPVPMTPSVRPRLEPVMEPEPALA